MFRNRLSAPRSMLRLSVDPISNAMAISAANPAFAPRRRDQPPRVPETWGSALADGVLADHLLSPIIHEFTHHTSLHTAVGRSLSALAVSHTSIVGALTSERDFTWMRDDVVRHALLNRLLRPLLEGLALFAEFDGVSGDIPVASWSQQAAGMLFCRPEMQRVVLLGQDPLSPLKTRLERLRMSGSLLERKRRLLSRGLDDPDGYLLGYLFVKALWNGLFAQAPMWRHTDFTLMFLSDYFFNDFTLARLMMGTPWPDVDGESDPWSIYLHQRIALLGRQSARFGREFFLSLADPVAPRPSYQGHTEIFERELQALCGMRCARNLHWHTPDFVSTRDIPRVLVSPATVRVSGSLGFEATFADGYSPMHGPALAAGLPSGGGESTGDGSVEAVLLLAGKGRKALRLLLCVLLDKDLIATFDPSTGCFNDPSDAQACDRLASYLALESFCVQVESERVFADGSPTGRLVESLQGEDGMRRMVALWAPYAFVEDPDQPDRPGVETLARAGSMCAALSLSVDEQACIARLSLQPLDDHSEAWRAVEGDERRTLDLVNERSQAVFGFRLLNVNNVRLLPSRI